jgi:lipoprotein-anchoring transpeptidase ErfK/SrfK
MRRSPFGKTFFAAALFSLACASVAGAFWYANAGALTIAYPLAAPTSTRALSYARVWIPKPIYTASPTSTLIPASPTVESSPTPGVVYAEIVPDTATPEAVAYLAETYSDAPSYAGYKSIWVDISSQRLYAYEGETLVYNFVASTGINNATRVGSFSVLNKIPNAYGATWNIWMPNWLGIYWAGGLQNGIHALPILPNGSQLWEGYLGIPISYGCVVLGAYEAQLLYEWAEIGTPVEIVW